METRPFRGLAWWLIGTAIFLSGCARLPAVKTTVPPMTPNHRPVERMDLMNEADCQFAAWGISARYVDQTPV